MLNPRTDTSTVPPFQHSPESLLSSLVCCLVLAAAAARFRLLCSFQYSLQRRSWKWMKRHITEAWKRHTNSSTLILPGAEKRQAENTAARPPPARPSPHTGAGGRGPPTWQTPSLQPPSLLSATPQPRAATFLSLHVIKISGFDSLILSTLGQELMNRIISTSTAQNTMWHSQDTMSPDDLKGGREVRKTLKSSGVPAVLGLQKA